MGLQSGLKAENIKSHLANWEWRVSRQKRYQALEVGGCLPSRVAISSALKLRFLVSIQCRINITHSVGTDTPQDFLNSNNAMVFYEDLDTVA